MKKSPLQCGFEIEEEEMYIPAGYTADSKSMMKVIYDCGFLVARKKPMDRKQNHGLYGMIYESRLLPMWELL